MATKEKHCTLSCWCALGIAVATGSHEKLLALPELMHSGKGSASDVGSAFEGVDSQRFGRGVVAEPLAQRGVGGYAE